MITAAARLFLGIAAFAVAAGIAHVAGSDGELYGAVVFASLLITAVLLAVAAVIHRDGHVPAGAGLAPSSDPQAGPSAWPAVLAGSAALAAIGLAAGPGYVALSFVLAGAAAFEWGARSWSEALSGDAQHNRAVRNRVMLPVEIPLGVTAVVAVTAIAISRLLLAVSATGAVVAAGVLSTLVVIVAALIATRPRVPRWVIGAVGVVGFLTVAGVGLTGALMGEREFHEHGDEHGSEHHDDAADHAGEGTGATDQAESEEHGSSAKADDHG